jgi:sugar transferase (PEP-CTERM/EpsH1 system associated)
MSAIDHRTVAPLIAHVVFRFDIGGLENGVVNLLNRLPRDRYRHVVISLTEVTDFAARVARDDVRFIALDKQPGHGAILWPRLTRLFRELRPALVHTRNIAALEAMVPAALAGVASRVHGEHGWDVGELARDNWRYRWTRRAYRPFVTHYVALSREIEGYLTNAIGVPRRRISRIINGVDTQRFRPRVAEREKIAGSPYDDPHLWLVGTVGRLAAVKDQMTLVRAFAAAVRARGERSEPMRLVIVGDGPDRAKLEQAVVREGIEDRTWFAGPRNDVAEIMRGLDCFVLPSLAEGISNTVLEAMASGLPIVATDVGGNRELLSDGDNGRIVPADDAAALAAAIGGLLDDPTHARRLGAAARRAAVERFSVERMAAEYARLYDRCLDRRPAAAMSTANS